MAKMLTVSVCTDKKAHFVSRERRRETRDEYLNREIREKRFALGLPTDFYKIVVKDGKQIKKRITEKQYKMYISVPALMDSVTTECKLK